MFNKKTVEDMELTGKRVLVRVDFNVPLDDERRITDDTRIQLALPTIKYMIGKGAKIILMSHLGRPKGVPEDRFRLDPVAARLSELLGKEVKKFDEVFAPGIKEYIYRQMDSGDVVMLENLRFEPGEKSNDRSFSANLASLAEIYVNDAFGAAHRAHASVVGVAEFLPAVSGFLMKKEIETLTALLEEPSRPFLTVLGGAKVSDKISVIKNLLNKVDCLILGGGMAYTFLKARGMEIGKSICEDDQVDYARDMMALAVRNKVKMLLPVDIVAGKEFDENTESRIVPVESIPIDWMGLDTGPKSIEIYEKEISGAAVIFWNGPLGVFEWKKFENGTKNIARAIAGSNAITVAGGGDTLAALKKYGLSSKISHVSSGGGASMELLEGKELPGIAALSDK
ncbi:MAG: phosphoglycerate kinase [Actinobacteria bacterium]|nr:phosphoglycerate kinase [Actinomycetota bacterium]